MAEKKGTLSINSDNIFPIIKKWLYSDHDIFFRELISNGCDAITKLKKLDMMGEYNFPEGHKNKVEVILDPEKKTLKCIDTGLGMTADEVEKYITQIAFSGATQFLEQYKDKTEGDQIIGHFGLGFYSAFMVADEVTIDTLLEKLKGYKLKVSKVCFQDFLFTEDIVGNFTVDLSSYGDAFSILQKYNDKISSMTIILYCDNSSIKLRITAKGRVTVYKSRSSMDDEEILFLHQILLNGGEH